MPKDSLGTFEVKVRKLYAQIPECVVCRQNVPTAVTYQQLEFAEKYADIDPQSTLFKKGMTFGIECGDYAKLHRQISHIHDSMERTNG